MSHPSDHILPAPGSLALRPALALAFRLVGQSVGDTARALRDEWRRERLAHATRRALQALDERTLRDLGFDRREISGYPDSTRRRAVVDPWRA